MFAAATRLALTDLLTQRFRNSAITIARPRKRRSASSTIIEAIEAQFAAKDDKRFLLDGVDYQTAFRITWIQKSLSPIGPRETLSYSVHRTPEAALSYLQAEWARANMSGSDEIFLDRGWTEPLKKLDELFWNLPKISRTEDQFPGHGIFPVNGWKRTIPVDIVAVSSRGPIWSTLRTRDTISPAYFWTNSPHSRQDFMENSYRAGEFKFEAQCAIVADEKIEFENESNKAYILGRHFFGLLPYRKVLKLGTAARANLG